MKDNDSTGIHEIKRHISPSQYDLKKKKSSSHSKRFKTQANADTNMNSILSTSKIAVSRSK